MMKLEQKFTADQLMTINGQAIIYMCNCPTQVSKEILGLRKLFDYQHMCLNKPSENEVQQQVHNRIAEASKLAHQIMEQCLDDILDLEGWDRNTLEMPAGLRLLIEKAIDEY